MQPPIAVLALVFAGDLGTVPLQISASRQLVNESNPAEQAIAIAWEKRRAERVQPALARLSSRSRPVVVNGGIDAQTISQAVRDVTGAPKGR